MRQKGEDTGQRRGDSEAAGAETGTTRPQIKNSEPPEAGKTRTRPSGEFLERVWLCPIRAPGLGTGVEYISVVKSHSVCGDFLWQPQETSTGAQFMSAAGDFQPLCNHNSIFLDIRGSPVRVWPGHGAMGRPLSASL